MTDSRKEERKKEGIRATIEVLHADKAPPGEKISLAITDDISFRGIKILSEKHVSVDSVLKIGLYLGEFNKKIDIAGKVRWINRLDDEMYEIGVELITSEASRDDLQALIDHLYRS